MSKQIITEFLRKELQEASGKSQSEIDGIPIRNLEIDSLDLFEVIYRLEDEFEVQMPDNIDANLTLQELVESINE